MEWVEGRHDIPLVPKSLFSRPTRTPTPPDVEVEFKPKVEPQRLRATLREAVASPSPLAGPSPPEGMVRVPAGPFISGDLWAPGLDIFFELGEPMMWITETEAFFIDIGPVTNAQYATFIEDGGYAREELWSTSGWEWLQAYHWTGPAEPGNGETADLPVRGVSYSEAEAYSRWCGKRLPTRREWEKAARGTDGRRWPWGDEFNPAHCNTADRHATEKQWGPTPVGAFPSGASSYGCLDLIGNVWEWLQDVTIIGGSFQSHFAASSIRECYGEEP